MKTLLLIALAAAAGCTSPTAGREPDETTGCATDETWRTFQDQEPTATVSDAMAPLVTMPAAGASVSASTQLIIKWQQDPNDVGTPGGDVNPTEPDCVTQYNTGALNPLHLPPISGDAYDLQFSVDGKVVWRVITTLQEWGSTTAALAAFNGKTVTLKIWRMAVLRNDVKDGPYIAAAPFSFSVGP
ncbi:MAG: hypothetical protein JWM53_4973 [bacterium]|nr:hypothetical protein [bacterium]